MARPSSTPQQQFEQGPVVIRPLRSLTSAQAYVVEQAMNALTVPWRVERHDDYDGYLSVVVSSDTPNAPTFAISGTIDRIELAEVRNDDLQAHGSFSSIDDAVAALVKLQDADRRP